MSPEEKKKAKNEIHLTLRSCNYCIGTIGISLIDDLPKTLLKRYKSYINLCVASMILVLVVVGQIYFLGSHLGTAKSVADIVGNKPHIAGYGLMSWGKLVTVWYKRNTFRKLVIELADIWPVTIKDKEAATIKRDCLSALKLRQNLYLFFNVLGVWLYNLTPIAVLLYRKARGEPSELGYVYHLSYPFDKTKPIYHEIAYIFESCGGVTSVLCMLGCDLLFITMASHISMLLLLLQVKIQNLISAEEYENTERFTTNISYDCYDKIVEVVQVHQRLINYLQDLEEAFSVSNLINVLLSSVNICCVMFSIVFLDPWMEMSNKFYLGAALTQMGIVCWYADNIYTASTGVADSVYKCEWYNCNVRCRRALLVMLQRSQKPLYFTTMKFGAITLTTYSSVLTTAYSYFTLLYTSYRGD